MGREIKFRIWDQKSNLYRGNLEKYLLNLQTGKIETKAHSDLYDDWYDTTDETEELVLEQFTGMQDRNGVDIYEGDILKWGMSYDSVNAFSRLRFVEFNMDKLIYKVVEVGDLPSLVDYLYEARQPSTRWCEVVGNINENPKLLK